MAHLVRHPASSLAALNQARVQLWLPQPDLSQCIRAIVSRRTLGIGRHWPPHWHYNHFPATPLYGIGWFTSGHVEVLAPEQPATADSHGQRLPSVYLSGPITRPCVSRTTPEGHGLMLILQPDALQALTGLNPGEWINRFAPLAEVLDSDWQALAEAVLADADDPARVARIEAFLAPRWHRARRSAASPRAVGSAASSASLHLQDWARGLAMRAAHSGLGRSLRQAERRIKGWTGLPMRELRGFGRAEQAFFRTLAEGEAPVRWAEVAADAGYADQPHLCRETRRITGFAPAELRQRIAEDEGFWMYRIWA